MIGTNMDAPVGMPPTTQRIAFAHMDAHQIVSGQVVGSWRLEDIAGALQQLGRAPTISRGPHDHTGAAYGRVRLRSGDGCGQGDGGAALLHVQGLRRLPVSTNLPPANRPMRTDRNVYGPRT